MYILFITSMFNFKALAASALIAVSSFGAIAPANAAATNCWIRESGRTAQPFRCNVTHRVNANGHNVWDVVHYENHGASFTVVLWTDNTADVVFKDQSLRVPTYTDSDGDERIVIGNMEFIIDFHQAMRS